MFYGEIWSVKVTVRWCIIRSQIVFQKDWFAVFKVKVTVKDNIIKIWLSNIMSELLILLQLNLVWWYIIIRCIFLWKDWIDLLCSRSRSKKRFRIPVNVYLDDISSAAESAVAKLGMVMQHMGQNVMQEDWLAVVKFRVTLRAHLIKYSCLYHICWSFCNQI